MTDIFKGIKYIAFDADDTLWNNETYFREAERKFFSLLSEYGSPESLDAILYDVEMSNLELLGYGAKAFTISMMEAAIRISGGKADCNIMSQLIATGKSLMTVEVPPLKGVTETLSRLKESGRYTMVVATKGDLLDQQRKLERSGLAGYFDHIEVMTDKNADEYRKTLHRLSAESGEFLMIGNSFKSDIAPVLAIGGYGIYIPSEVMWKHEVTDVEKHPHCVELTAIGEVPGLLL